MGQTARRSPSHPADLEEFPLIPAPRQEPGIGRDASHPALLLPDLDDEIDTDVDGAPVPSATGVVEVDTLSQRERDILAFEKQWWRNAGAKEQAIRDRFSLSGTRYYQLLNALLDRSAALALDPVLVGRLRRLRGSRARSSRH